MAPGPAPGTPGILGIDGIIIGPAAEGLFGNGGIDGIGGGEGNPGGGESCGLTRPGDVPPGGALSAGGDGKFGGIDGEPAGAAILARSTRTNVVLCGKTIVSFLASRSRMLIGSSLFVVFSIRSRLPSRVKRKCAGSVPARARVAETVPSNVTFLSAPKTDDDVINADATKIRTNEFIGRQMR